MEHLRIYGVTRDWSSSEHCPGPRLITKDSFDPFDRLRAGRLRTSRD